MATPPELFAALDAVHHFSLDAAATDENAKCPLYFTKREDALSKNWGGTACFAIPHTGA